MKQIEQKKYRGEENNKNKTCVSAVLCVYYYVWVKSSRKIESDYMVCTSRNVI